jgi:excinuclease ABC subunit C
MMTYVKEKAKKLPTSPGVYLMKDSTGGILYVGKAKNLKNRVQSYFQQSKNHTEKVKKLVKHLKDFETIQTDTEFEAFLLECRLIQEIKPLYNRSMKSPQSYVYVMFRKNNGRTTIELAQTMSDRDENLYFGPFKGRRTLENAINSLKDFFKIACSNPTQNTPCLNYSLGLCMGSCFDRTTVDKYNDIMNRITGLFNGSDTSIVEEMELVMEEASVNFEFEKAARIRDSLEAIKAVLKKEKVIEFAKEKNNIVVVESIDELVGKVFLISGNKIIFSGIFKRDRTLGRAIKRLILDYFALEASSSPENISKNEIDQAQIIYSYLNSNNCDYLHIPNRWLSDENHEEMDNAIDVKLASV